MTRLNTHGIALIWSIVAFLPALAIVGCARKSLTCNETLHGTGERVSSFTIFSSHSPPISKADLGDLNIEIDSLSYSNATTPLSIRAFVVPIGDSYEVVVVDYCEPPCYTTSIAKQLEDYVFRRLGEIARKQ
jgi:hypothetical protein